MLPGDLANLLEDAAGLALERAGAILDQRFAAPTVQARPRPADPELAGRAILLSPSLGIDPEAVPSIVARTDSPQGAPRNGEMEAASSSISSRPSACGLHSEADRRLAVRPGHDLIQRIALLARSALHATLAIPQVTRKVIQAALAPLSSLLPVPVPPLLFAFVPEGGRAARRKPLRARCARP